MTGKPQASRTPPGHLSPAAFDSWWRHRIEKEEGKNPESVTRAKNWRTTDGQKMMIAGDHLVGAGAIVKPKKGEGEVTTTSLDNSNTASASPKLAADTLEALNTPRHKQHHDLGSVAGSRASVRPAGGSVASGHQHAGSVSQQHGASKSSQVVSYPKTPSYSTAPSGSVTQSVIMNKLAKLEQELTVERQRREAAEREMRTLLEVAATTTPMQ